MPIQAIDREIQRVEREIRWRKAEVEECLDKVKNGEAFIENGKLRLMDLHQAKQLLGGKS